jgi:hypothetical protein
MMKARSRSCAVFAVLTVLLSGSCAFAQDIDGHDIDVYCKKFFPNSKTPFSTLGQTVPVCFNVEQGKGVLRHIDFAVLCELTKGTPRFHYIDGFLIRCGSKPHTYVSRGPGVHLFKPEDMKKYCAQALGPGAHAAYSPELKRVVCTGADAPGPNPLTINLAVACDFVFGTNKVRYVDGGARDYPACVD